MKANNVRLLWRSFVVAVLQDFFIPYLDENYWNIQHVWCQKDGETSHTSMSFIRKAFAGRRLSIICDILWQIYSPDPSSCDFFL